jgi:transcriptional regulator with XRE-family HTH domain
VKDLSAKEKYIIKRRRKKIRLRQLAEFIGCSQSLVSRYETENCEMDIEKIRKYRGFIDSY